MELWSLPRVPFVFLRHGETAWNLEGRLQGQTDIPLNDTGRRQARAAAEMLRGQPLSRVVHSPLGRTRETAELAAGDRGLDFAVEPELGECGFGAMEGFCANRELPGWRAAWQGGAPLRDAAGQVVGDAESYQGFLARAERALARLLLAGAPDEAPVLVVAHGGIYWAIQRALDTGLKGDLPNCLPILHRPTAAGGWAVEALGEPPR
jgi:broad specificity phosphatase PhoE